MMLLFMLLDAPWRYTRGIMMRFRALLMPR